MAVLSAILNPRSATLGRLSLRLARKAAMLSAQWITGLHHRSTSVKAVPLDFKFFSGCSLALLNGG